MTWHHITSHDITQSWIKPGAVVIDVGINRLDNGRIVGDVVFEEALPRASYITPGTNTVITCVFKHGIVVVPHVSVQSHHLYHTPCITSHCSARRRWAHDGGHAAAEHQGCLHTQPHGLTPPRPDPPVLSDIATHQCMHGHSTALELRFTGVVQCEGSSCSYVVPGDAVVCCDGRAVNGQLRRCEVMNHMHLCEASLLRNPCNIDRVVDAAVLPPLRTVRDAHITTRENTSKWRPSIPSMPLTFSRLP